MHNILKEIIENKKLEIAKTIGECPLSELKNKTRKCESVRDFKAALSSKDVSIISEIKRKSPTAGVFSKDFDPFKQAVMYSKAGADAISVLTDEKYFGGSLEYINTVKGAVSLPVLRKDFILDEYQVYESYYAGADAILLIASVLESEKLQILFELTKETGLNALVEVHGADDINKAINAGADIVGINNRDLVTFKVSLLNSVNLAKRIPKEKLVVSESGIKSRQDIEILLKSGIHSFLIGESLMKSENIQEKIASMKGKTNV